MIFFYHTLLNMNNFMEKVNTNLKFLSGEEVEGEEDRIKKERKYSQREIFEMKKTKINNIKSRLKKTKKNNNK